MLGNTSNIKSCLKVSVSEADKRCFVSVSTVCGVAFNRLAFLVDEGYFFVTQNGVDKCFLVKKR